MNSERAFLFVANYNILKNIANKLSIYLLKLRERELFSIKAEMNSKYRGHMFHWYILLWKIQSQVRGGLRKSRLQTQTT